MLSRNESDFAEMLWRWSMTTQHWYAELGRHFSSHKPFVYISARSWRKMFRLQGMQFLDIKGNGIFINNHVAKETIKCFICCLGLRVSKKFSKFQILLKTKIYVYLFLTRLQSLQELSSLTRDWTQTTAVKALSHNHWTTREFLPNSLEYSRPSWTVFMREGIYLNSLLSWRTWIWETKKNLMSYIWPGSRKLTEFWKSSGLLKTKQKYPAIIR